MRVGVNDKTVFQNRNSAVGKYRITESCIINTWFVATYLH